jgi:hypothetical protein
VTRIAGRRTYRLPDGRVCIDCPCCGSAARVAGSGRNLHVHCYAQCADEDVLEALRSRRGAPTPPSDPVAPPDPEWGFSGFTDEEKRAMREGRWP